MTALPLGLFAGALSGLRGAETVTYAPDLRPRHEHQPPRKTAAEAVRVREGNRLPFRYLRRRLCPDGGGDESGELVGCTRRPSAKS